jgi:hypothetical protein
MKNKFQSLPLIRDPIAPPTPTTNPLVMKTANTRNIPVSAVAANPVSPAVIVPPIIKIIEITIAPNAPATRPLPNPLSIPPPTINPTTIPAKNNPILIPINPKKKPNKFESITARINPTNAATQLTK